MTQKPLFIPLRREPFESFRSGQKKTEYRIYGPRWNERTCTVGRDVVLSLGYGTRNRLRGKITGFQRRTDKPEWWPEYFGDKPGDAACIAIEVQP